MHDLLACDNCFDRLPLFPLLAAQSGVIVRVHVSRWCSVQVALIREGIRGILAMTCCLSR